jgi:hypothetical protein
VEGKMIESRLGRRFLLATTALLVALLPACGNSGGGGGTVPSGFTAAFAPSATARQADLVRFVGASVTGDVATVAVAIGGPTTSTDLYAFAFDVVLSDFTVASYVAGSATVGDALTPGGGGVSTIATQNGNRVVVGVSKLGAAPGNGVTANEATIVELSFRVLKAGTTTLSFGGSASAQNPTGVPAALDSSGNLVGSVTFDTAAATLTGS